MRTAFTGAHLLEPGGYGRQGREILVTEAGAGIDPEYIASLTAGANTRFVGVPDNNPELRACVRAELSVFLRYARFNNGGYARPVELEFKNLDDFKRNFLRMLHNRAGIPLPHVEGVNLAFPNLLADAENSIRSLSRRFNFNAPFTFDVMINTGGEVIEHTDFFRTPDKHRLVRILSDIGTLVLPHDAIDIRFGHPRPYNFLETPWHIGPGLNIIGGNNIHAAAPAPGSYRYGYTIDAERLETASP